MKIQLPALAGVALLAACGGRGTPAPSPAPSPVASVAIPERAVRRDIPMTSVIRRAHAMGTRDSTGRPGPRYWQNWADYRIDARLDVPTSTISGRERIVFHNRSDSTLRVVALRLEQNILTPRAQRASPAPATIELTDGMRITRITVNGQPAHVVTATSAPPSGAPMAANLDQTIARLTVPGGIAPKGSVTFEFDWSFKVPAIEQGRGLRGGRQGDTLYQVSYWYPKLAVYDDLRGWNAEPYLGPSEFYHEFGRFEVNLDVPAGWLVGATGVLQNPEQVLSARTRERLARVLDSDSTRTIVGAAEMGAGRATAAGDRLVWRFVADTVNDFAFAASRSYLWEATRATIPGRGPIPVHILRLPGSTQNFPPQIGPVLRHALEYYSQLWMPYAFPQLTTADGPELGMEYPMFLMSGLGAADHEAGHEWWPMMVGNNETWYGWMDEGFNMYMNRLSTAHRNARAPVLDSLGQSYGRISGSEDEPPMMWNANYGGPVYGFTAYNKAPLMLSSLGGIVGDSAVQRAMSDWARAWRFKHPSPWDYMFFMNRALGRDLGWFWYYWLFTTEATHGSIQGVSTSGSRTVVTVRQDGEMPSPVVLEVRFAAQGPPITPMAGAVMRDSVTAVVTWPVDVWFGGRRTFDATLDFGGRAIERIRLDPGARFPDREPRDNVWPR
ncbi:MAG TPA: M1 family metallopeptidase [Gemmatimonadaceae bacterium]|nr:M1 family metallopeptidase [Gemmatimonadaceae bacterium]